MYWTLIYITVPNRIEFPILLNCDIHVFIQLYIQYKM